MRICAAVIGAVATHAFVAPQPRLCRRRRPLVRAEDAERLPTLEELALKRADSLIEADAAAADAAPRLDSAASSLGASEALKADAERFRQRREALGDAGAPVGPSPIKSVVNAARRAEKDRVASKRWQALRRIRVLGAHDWPPASGAGARIGRPRSSPRRRPARASDVRARATWSRARERRLRRDAGRERANAC